MVYLGAMSNYAHITNRLHRETMRLRYENKNLIDDLEAGEDAALRFVVRSWLPDDVCAACEATPGVQ